MNIALMSKLTLYKCIVSAFIQRSWLIRNWTIPLLNMTNEEPKEPVNVETNQGRKSEPSSNTESGDNPTTTEQRKHNNPEAMETQHSVQGCKRQFSGDSDDSDDKVQSRRTKINPVPNFSHARSKSKDKSTKENRR